MWIGYYFCDFYCVRSFEIKVYFFRVIFLGSGRVGILLYYGFFDWGDI